MPEMEEDGSFVCAVNGIIAFYISYTVFASILTPTHNALQMTHGIKGFVFGLVGLSIIGLLAYRLYRLLKKEWHILSGKQRKYEKAMAEYNEAMERYYEDYAV